MRRNAGGWSQRYRRMDGWMVGRVRKSITHSHEDQGCYNFDHGSFVTNHIIVMR